MLSYQYIDNEKSQSCRFRVSLVTCGRGTRPSLRSGLGLRPEWLQKSQLSRTVRPVRPAKTAAQTGLSRPMQSATPASLVNGYKVTGIKNRRFDS